MRRKLAFGTIGVLVLVVVVGTWWHFAWAKQVAATQRRTTGRLLADQAILVMHWENLEERPPAGGETGNDFVHVIQELSKKLSSQEHDCRLIFPANSPLAQRGERPRGEFEKELLDRFAQTRPQEPGEADWGERPTPDGRGYEYYQAVRAQALCLSLCHRPAPTLDATAKSGFGKPLREGDLMAVVAVRMPNAGPKWR